MFTTVAKAKQDVYLKGKDPGVVKTVDGNNWTSAQVGDTIPVSYTHLLLRCM